MFSGGKIKSIPLLLIIPLIFVFFTAGLSAQDAEEETNNSQNSLVKGSKSFQFRISPDFTLSAFDGAMVSAKMHFSQNSALRFGIGLDVGVGSTDDGARDKDFTDFEIDLNMQYVYYPSPLSSINFYIGSGPLVQYQRHKEDAKYEDGADAGYGLTRSWSIGLLGSWGVEWFADENISFISEYGAGIRYTSNRMENHLNPNPMDTKSHETSFFSQGVDFGLSVYF